MGYLPQQSTILQYDGNGSTTVFAFNFLVPEDIDIAVYVTPEDQEPDEQADIQELDVNYTVSGAGVTDGGSITFISGAPPSGSYVTLSRNVIDTITTNYINATNYSGLNLDNSFEREMLCIQQNSTFINERNLRYAINSFLPNIGDLNILPVLSDEGMIWQRSGDGIAAVVLEENPDVSTLRSELANEGELTDGARLVGYYDNRTLDQTTVHDFLNNLSPAILNVFGDDISADVNAIEIETTQIVSSYVLGMQITFLKVGTQTNNSITLKVNDLDAIIIYRDNDAHKCLSGDFKDGYYYTVIYDGTEFVYLNYNSDMIGVQVDYMGGAVQPGFFLCDGTEKSRVTFEELYERIGTIWGVGDGSTTFNLPLSERRVTVGSGGTGTATLGDTTGDYGGEEDHTMIATEIAAHAHALPNVRPDAGNQSARIAGGVVDPEIANLETQNSGDATPFNVIQPSMVVTKMIKF